tara:strand:+ start:51 stop:515 length:465 start_codon:yes stop_codon:yes gene_type:complete
MKGFNSQIKEATWQSSGISALKWLGKGLLLGGAAAGTELAIDSAVDRSQQRNAANARNKILMNVLDAHPELKAHPAKKVEQYFDTLYRFSPSLAADPLGAGAFIRQAIRMDEFGGPPPDTIKNLADIEDKRLKSRKSLGFKTLSGFEKDPFGTN